MGNQEAKSLFCNNFSLLGLDEETCPDLSKDKNRDKDNGKDIAMVEGKSQAITILAINVQSLLCNKTHLLAKKNYPQTFGHVKVFDKYHVSKQPQSGQSRGAKVCFAIIPTCTTFPWTWPIFGLRLVTLTCFAESYCKNF